MHDMSTLHASPSARKLHIDILRLVAICGVVYMHINNISFPPINTANGYWFYLAINMCIRVAIPIFFMITGAVLLHRQEDCNTVITKRICHFLVILAACILIQLLISTWSLHPEHYFQTLAGVTHNYLKINDFPIAMGAHWYLFAYLAILIMLPITRTAAQGMSNKTHLYFISAYILTVFILPVGLHLAGYPFHHPIHNHLPFYETVPYWLPNGGMNWIFYTIVGYYLEHRIKHEKITPKLLLFLTALSIICIAMACGMMEHVRIRQGLPKIENFFFATKFTIIPAITLYLVAKYIFTHVKLSAGISNTITKLGRAVIIVFLFENLIRKFTVPIYRELNSELAGYGYASIYIASIIWLILVVSIGLLIGLTLQYIPGIKRFV